jgi:hypothetical protein
MNKLLSVLNRINISDELKGSQKNEQKMNKKGWLLSKPAFVYRQTIF